MISILNSRGSFSARPKEFLFFIEEFVKCLQGLQLIKREDGRVLLQGDPQSITIPSTIQDMIMAG